jgi:hypothetical protein
MTYAPRRIFCLSAAARGPAGVQLLFFLLAIVWPSKLRLPRASLGFIGKFGFRVAAAVRVRINSLCFAGAVDGVVFISGDEHVRSIFPHPFAKGWRLFFPMAGNGLPAGALRGGGCEPSCWAASSFIWILQFQLLYSSFLVV